MEKIRTQVTYPTCQIMLHKDGKNNQVISAFGRLQEKYSSQWTNL